MSERNRNGRQCVERRDESGVSLLVVLVLLLVMSVLGLAVLRSSAMQERMSANMYDRNLAQQAAETAILAAHAYLASGVAGKNWEVEEPTAADCTNHSICDTFNRPAAGGWQAGPTVGGGANDGIPETTSGYWIEYLGMNQAHMESGGVIPAPGTTSVGPLYRITAASPNPNLSPSGRATIVLQSDVIHRLPRL